MMLDKVDYGPVSAIVDDLLAKGQLPSADRVRERLGGRGSNQTIMQLVKVRLRELGRLPQEDGEENTRQALTVAVLQTPAVDPVAIAAALKALRLETCIARAMAEAEAFIRGRTAGTEPRLPTTRTPAHRPTTEGSPDGFDFDPA